MLELLGGMGDLQLDCWSKLLKNLKVLERNVVSWPGPFTTTFPREVLLFRQQCMWLVFLSGSYWSDILLTCMS
jgi:hypothetical protein